MTHEEQARAVAHMVASYFDQADDEEFLRNFQAELVREFAAIEREARADERERCARECDRLSFRSDKIYASAECAAAIRELKPNDNPSR